jgi:hypothetical protein
LLGGQKYQRKITKDGIFVEQLEVNPARLLPETAPHLEPAVDIDLNQPMADILKKLSQYPIKTRLKLNGTLIVARDIAHAKIKELLDAGKPMPDYFKTIQFIMLVLQNARRNAFRKFWTNYCWSYGCVR